MDRRLTFEKHATAVAKSCYYHAQAIRHIRHLLTPDLAQTLACSLILSRIDYCNALLHGTTAATIHKLQRVQNNAAHIVLQAPKRSDAKPLLRSLHWLPVKQWSQAVDHLQDSRANTQGPEHRNPSIPLPPHTDTRLYAKPSLVRRSIAGTTFQDN